MPQRRGQSRARTCLCCRSSRVSPSGLERKLSAQSATRPASVMVQSPWVVATATALPSGGGVVLSRLAGDYVAFQSVSDIRSLRAAWGQPTYVVQHCIAMRQNCIAVAPGLDRLGRESSFPNGLCNRRLCHRARFCYPQNRASMSRSAIGGRLGWPAAHAKSGHRSAQRQLMAEVWPLSGRVRTVRPQPWEFLGSAIFPQMPVDAGGNL